MFQICSNLITPKSEILTILDSKLDTVEEKLEKAKQENRMLLEQFQMYDGSNIEKVRNMKKANLEFQMKLEEKRNAHQRMMHQIQKYEAIATHTFPAISIAGFIETQQKQNTQVIKRPLSPRMQSVMQQVDETNMEFEQIEKAFEADEFYKEEVELVKTVEELTEKVQELEAKNADLQSKLEAEKEETEVLKQEFREWGEQTKEGIKKLYREKQELQSKLKTSRIVEQPEYGDSDVSHLKGEIEHLIQKVKADEQKLEKMSSLEEYTNEIQEKYERSQVQLELQSVTLERLQKLADEAPVSVPEVEEINEDNPPIPKAEEIHKTTRKKHPGWAMFYPEHFKINGRRHRRRLMAPKPQLRPMH